MHASRLVFLLVSAVAFAAPAGAQLDCEDVDHDCAPDRFTRRGIRKAGAAFLRCDRLGITPCDLTEALEDISSPECRFAVECQMTELHDLVADTSTPCLQKLFRQGYSFMVKKTSRIEHESFDRIPDDLARCILRAPTRCDDPIAPPLTNACAGNTTPADGATCVCNAADTISDRMLLRPATCIQPAAPMASNAFDIRPLAAGVRPNIVLILTDDQRWDTVDATHESPNRSGPVMPIVTSELVNSGVTFSRGYVTTALCCPSRTSILSGQYSHNTGVLDNSPPDGGAEVFDDTQTIALWLQAAGYKTAFVGKYLNGYLSLAPCIPPGWDEWHVFHQVKFYDYDFNDNGVVTHFGNTPADYSQEILTQRAVDFIHAAGPGAPFFLHFSTKAPHGPATPAPSDIGLFMGLAPFRPPNYAEADVTDKPAWVQAQTWTANEQSSTDQFRIDQLESLQAVDRGVGAIMQALRDIGEDDNTLVVFTGDNAFSWGSHRWRPKTCPYEECMHVPMIMRYPPLGTTPRNDDHFVLNVDFAPTFVELAEATIPPSHVVNGQSLVPVLAGTAGAGRKDMLNEHWNGAIPDNALVKQGRCSATTGTVCVINADCPSGETCKQWKYVEYETAETELYDLSVDPYELTNITTSADPMVQAVKSALAARLADLRND
jgi:arylsulfatase A-like enzyme